MNDVVYYVKVILRNQKYALIVFRAQVIQLRGIFMLTLKHVHGLVGTLSMLSAKETNTLLLTLLVTCVVRAISYQTIHLIGTHCVRVHS